MAADSGKDSSGSESRPPSDLTMLGTVSDRLRATMDDGLFVLSNRHRRIVFQALKLAFGLFLTGVLIYFVLSFQFEIQWFDF